MDCSLPGFSARGILQAGILEWVAMPFSRGSSQPRDQTQVSCTADRFFTSWATREAPVNCIMNVFFLPEWSYPRHNLKTVVSHLFFAFVLIFFSIHLRYGGSVAEWCVDNSPSLWCKHLMSTGKRTSALVFFGERIPQDIVKQAEFLEAQYVQRERRSSLFRAEAKQKYTPREECRCPP